MDATLSILPKFNLTYLYEHAQSGLMTYGRCVKLVGTGIAWYSHHDVYDRVILWRVPLLALWATTILPAFAFHTQVFTLVHVISSPIDTIWSLLYKLDLAKRTTQWAKDNDEGESSFLLQGDGAQMNGTAAQLTPRGRIAAVISKVLPMKETPLEQYHHDVPALIVTAYDEWSRGDQAFRAMNYAL